MYVYIDVNWWRVVCRPHPCVYICSKADTLFLIFHANATKTKKNKVTKKKKKRLHLITYVIRA